MSENYEFKVGDKGKTRDGRDYEVVAVVPRLDQPVIALVNYGEDASLGQHNANGRFYLAGTSERDLIPPPRVVWVNLGESGAAVYFDSEDAARRKAFVGKWIGIAVRVELP